MTPTAPKQTLQAALKAANIPISVRVVRLDRVHPNAHNPNRQDDRTKAAERESIAEYGFIVPVVVRKHPELRGHWQLIDGEHRKLAAEDLGLEQVPVVVVDVPDSTAKKLTIVLNETRGEPDGVLLGTLLHELHVELGDDLRTGLRYDDAELKHLLALADDPLPGVGGGFDGARADDEWYTLTARLPADFRQTWDAAREKVGEAGVELHADGKVAAGQLIEIFVANYLANP